MTDGILRQVIRGSTVTQAPSPAPVPLVGLLDTYSGAAVAYSFRKLRNAYGGSAVRIRRSSDNAEADVGFDANGDFDTAAAASHIGGGSGFIVTWYDQSGNGDDVTQATAGLQPAYTASGIGSLPCLTLSTTTNTRLVTAADAISPSVGDNRLFSGFAVAKMESATDSNGRLFVVRDNGQTSDTNNNQSAAIILRNTTTNAVAAFNTNAVRSTISISLATAYRIASIYDSTNNIVYVDTVAGTTVAANPNLGNSGLGLTLWVGSSSAGTANWDGQCSEVVLYLTNQTANRTGIDSNQETYYGL